MKNILILSDYLPMDGWGGGVIIRSLTKNHPKTLNLFWTMPIFKNDKVTCNNIKILKFHTYHFRGRGVFEIILWIEAYIFIYNFKKLLKNNHIDLVWIVLGTSYDKLFRIEKLMKRVKIPFHISVHDDPIEEIKKNKKFKATILFQNILEKATSIDVISLRMQEQYKKQYGINSIVVTRCISDDFPQNNKISKDKINILMGGYGNASMPWPNPLVETINQLNKKIDCQLFLFDPKLKQYENKYIKVSNLIDENSFNNLLETINIGYACDDLSPNKARFAQLSLPTKIITYIGAGIPFIYHGPLDSTVNDLIKTIEVGIVVSTNNSDDLVIAFETLLLKYEFYHRNCLQAKEKLFSQHIVQKFFYENLLKNIQ